MDTTRTSTEYAEGKAAVARVSRGNSMKMPLKGLCGCRKGIERDNCANCEGTGIAIDWSKYWEEKRKREAVEVSQ